MVQIQSGKETLSALNPLVSIVTIVFNGEKYLAETIESVLNQTYPSIEHIIIDGGSTDGTLDVIKKYQTHFSFWMSEKDRGLADAMNKSIKYCRGEYVLFLHADDKLEESAITELVLSLNLGPGKWAMGFYKYINSQGQITRQDKVRDFTFFDMILRNVVRHQATIVPLEIFKSIIFEEGYKYALDYMFFLKVWGKLGTPQIIKKHLTRFRLDGNNLSSNFYGSINDEMKVRKNYRESRGEAYKLPFDYLIYSLRLLKIFVYHSRVQNVG